MTLSLYVRLYRQKPAVAFVHDDWLGSGRRADARASQGAAPTPPRPCLLGSKIRKRAGPDPLPLGRSLRIPSAASRATTRSRADGSPRHVRDPLGDQRAPFADAAPARVNRPGPLRRANGRERGSGSRNPGTPRRAGCHTRRSRLTARPDRLGGLARTSPHSARTRRPSALPRRSGPAAILAAYADKRGDACRSCAYRAEWCPVALEAIRSWHPVIATRTRGSSEYLVDGVNALLYSADDPVHSPQTVFAASWADDGPLRTALRQAGFSGLHGRALQPRGRINPHPSGGRTDGVDYGAHTEQQDARTKARLMLRAWPRAEPFDREAYFLSRKRVEKSPRTAPRSPARRCGWRATPIRASSPLGRRPVIVAIPAAAQALMGKLTTGGDLRGRLGRVGQRRAGGAGRAGGGGTWAAFRGLSDARAAPARETGHVARRSTRPCVTTAVNLEVRVAGVLRRLQRVQTNALMQPLGTCPGADRDVRRHPGVIGLTAALSSSSRWCRSSRLALPSGSSRARPGSSSSTSQLRADPGAAAALLPRRHAHRAPRGEGAGAFGLGGFLRRAGLRLHQLHGRLTSTSVGRSYPVARGEAGDRRRNHRPFALLCGSCSTTGWGWPRPARPCSASPAGGAHKLQSSQGVTGLFESSLFPTTSIASWRGTRRRPDAQSAEVARGRAPFRELV